MKFELAKNGLENSALLPKSTYALSIVIILDKGIDNILKNDCQSTGCLTLNLTF